MWHKIKEYQQEGLAWGESFKLEPVAYGIKKLVMTVTIVDSLVVLDDITENIEVQGVLPTGSILYVCMYDVYMVRMYAESIAYFINNFVTFLCLCLSV